MTEKVKDTKAVRASTSQSAGVLMRPAQSAGDARSARAT